MQDKQTKTVALPRKSLYGLFHAWAWLREESMFGEHDRYWTDDEILSISAMLDYLGPAEWESVFLENDYPAIWRLELGDAYLQRFPKPKCQYCKFNKDVELFYDESEYEYAHILCRKCCKSLFV